MSTRSVLALLLAGTLASSGCAINPVSGQPELSLMSAERENALGKQAAQEVSQLGQMAGAGLIASYGRDQERQADEVGQQLSSSSGWDPGAMSNFFITLGRQTKLEHRERRPSFLNSHPMTSERAL